MAGEQDVKEEAAMSGDWWNPWKLATIGMVLVMVTALVTGLVVASWHTTDKPETAATSTRAAASVPVTRHVAAAPSSSDVEACNLYAQNQVGDKTTEVLKDALIGAVVGAGAGAAGGAIAGGGRNAGKGAGVGGVVGATAGTLYGLNGAKSRDARYVEAYRGCLRGRGYTG